MVYSKSLQQHPTGMYYGNTLLQQYPAAIYSKVNSPQSQDRQVRRAFAKRSILLGAALSKTMFSMSHAYRLQAYRGAGSKLQQGIKKVHSMQSTKC